MQRTCATAWRLVRAVAIGVALGAATAPAQWLNVELPELDQDEINAERTRQRRGEAPSIGEAWDWTTMTQADLMREAVPVLAANTALCGDRVIRYLGELVCDFFPFYLSNESHANAYTDGVRYLYITADGQATPLRRGVPGRRRPRDRAYSRRPSGQDGKAGGRWRDSRRGAGRGADRVGGRRAHRRGRVRGVLGDTRPLGHQRQRPDQLQRGAEAGHRADSSRPSGLALRRSLPVAVVRHPNWPKDRATITSPVLKEADGPPRVRARTAVTRVAILRASRRACGIASRPNTRCTHTELNRRVRLRTLGAAWAHMSLVEVEPHG